jgi:NodT family efflux transporter outer membrane factor (OMF) lipoprotein
MSRWLGGVVGLVLLASGCTGPLQYVRNGFKVGPAYQPPAAPLASAWLEQDNSQGQQVAADLRRWWHVFQDPQLDWLIQTACQQNRDVKAAATRILEALAQRNIQAGNLFPQSQSALAAYAHAQLSKNLGLPFPRTVFTAWTTGFNASWELDFWGRYRRSVEAADAQLAASIEDYHDVLVLLTAEVASQYVQLRTLEQRLRYVEENVRLQRGVLEIARLRFQKGAVTELDVQQAQANLAQTEALLPPLRAARDRASHQLCLLLGLPPAPLANQLGSGAIPRAPEEVDAGIPADLLRRRPDIRRAEREVAAQCALLGVAEADLYPRFVLFGFLGTTADSPEHLFQASSFTGLIAPVVQWNILNYGRLRNQVRLQAARLQEKVWQYQQTVLRAQQEAEDALSNFRHSREQLARLQDSVAAYRRSAELVLEQYRAGTADFNRVYTTQAALVVQEDQLALTQGAVALNLIAVYRALGGGWENGPLLYPGPGSRSSHLSGRPGSCP